jgi:hypothetical protein
MEKRQGPERAAVKPGQQQAQFPAEHPPCGPPGHPPCGPPRDIPAARAPGLAERVCEAVAGFATLGACVPLGCSLPSRADRSSLARLPLVTGGLFVAGAGPTHG